MNNLESVLTYEGTVEMHTLVVVGAGGPVRLPLTPIRRRVVLAGGLPAWRPRTGAAACPARRTAFQYATPKATQARWPAVSCRPSGG